MEPTNIENNENIQSKQAEPTVEKVDAENVKITTSFDPTEEIFTLQSLKEDADQAEKDLADLETYYLAEKTIRQNIALKKRKLATDAEAKINTP